MIELLIDFLFLVCSMLLFSIYLKRELDAPGDTLTRIFGIIAGCLTLTNLLCIINYFIN